MVNFKEDEQLKTLNHSCAHVMAQAIKRIWPETKLAIGPSIADGFYYDIDRDEPVTSDDLAKIEAEMKKDRKKRILRSNSIQCQEKKRLRILKKKNEPYKVELIKDLPEGENDQFLFTGRIYRSVRRSASYDNKTGESI